jgi:putative hydrolase of the HAD superfamily
LQNKVGTTKVFTAGEVPGGVRAVLLDCLGTLVALAPPAPIFAAALRRDHGLALTSAEADWAFASEMAYYRAHHHEGCDPAALGDLRRRCAEVLHASLPPATAHSISLTQLTGLMLDALRFKAHPDALETLPLLRARGIVLVVVSNWDISLAPVLQSLGLQGLLDAVLTSAEVGHPKPAPEIFRAALARVGVSPEQALHVGDSFEEDVAGARAAGVFPVLLRRRGAYSPGAAPADVPTISSLAGLPGLLRWPAAEPR